jgi:hypothetical protein
MNKNTPVIFTDGTTFFEELSKDYIMHDRGLFILAPSGAGKTHFVNGQEQKNWVDGDYLWPLAGADLSGDEWNDDLSQVEEINIRCDAITNQATKQGFWIIGSSNSSLRPDAIVLPPWNVHLAYIKKRENTVYDGGARAENIESLRSHRKIIAQWKHKSVPAFMSIKEAAEYLSTHL